MNLWWLTALRGVFLMALVVFVLSLVRSLRRHNRGDGGMSDDEE